MPRLDKLSAEELDQIRRLIENTDIDAVSDKMRELVEKHWPWLLASCRRVRTIESGLRLLGN